MERDREATEKKLMEAVGEIIAEQGFEKMGINAVSAQSGVSKILIYRYFGSLEGLIAAYIRKKDFWLNVSPDFTDASQLAAHTKEMFHQQIERLRTDPVMRKLYRWELSCNNELITRLREQREQVGMNLIRQVCQLTGRPQQEVAFISSLIISSVSYLAMLSDFCPVYNGIRIDEDEGWKQIQEEIDRLVDKIL